MSTRPEGITEEPAQTEHGIGCRCAGLNRRCAVVVRREEIEKQHRALQG